MRCKQAQFQSTENNTLQFSGTKHEKLEIEFSSESEQNLNQLNEILAENSAVFYLNHTSKMDAVLAIFMIFSQLPNATRLLGPAGMRHYDWRRDPSSALLLRLLTNQT